MFAESSACLIRRIAEQVFWSMLYESAQWVSASCDMFARIQRRKARIIVRSARIERPPRRRAWHACVIKPTVSLRCGALQRSLPHRPKRNDFVSSPDEDLLQAWLSWLRRNSSRISRHTGYRCSSELVVQELKIHCVVRHVDHDTRRLPRHFVVTDISNNSIRGVRRSGSVAIGKISVDAIVRIGLPGRIHFAQLFNVESLLRHQPRRLILSNRRTPSFQ
jgi:hypothetical protein